MSHPVFVGLCSGLAIVVVAFVNLMVIVFVSKSWNNANNTVNQYTTNLVNDAFPTYTCINTSTTLVGYFCQQVSFECDLPGNTNSYEPIGDGNWTTVLSTLYTCGGIGGWNNNNTSSYTKSNVTDLIHAFLEFKYIAGISYNTYAPTLYTTQYYGSSGQGSGKGPADFTLQFVGNTAHDFFNVLLLQNALTPYCLNNTSPLDTSETYNCAGKPWYISAPYCAPYYCQYGVNGPNIANYRVLNAASAQNISVTFAHLTGDFTFMTALYTGAITNAYASFAVLCAIVFTVWGILATL